MTTIYWPRSLLMPRHASPDPMFFSTSGPPSLSGDTQTVTSPAGIWRIKYDAIPVTRARISVWSALRSQIQGRANAIVVPVYTEWSTLPWIGGTPAAAAFVPHDDGSALSDGSLYETPPFSVTAAAPVARGAMVMDLDTSGCGEIVAGAYFSIGLRLYVVSSIEAQDANTATITFWPMAREAIVAGSELDFLTPSCKCRLESDGQMDLKTDYGRFAFPAVTFREDVR